MLLKDEDGVSENENIAKYHNINPYEDDEELCNYEASENNLFGP